MAPPSALEKMADEKEELEVAAAVDSDEAVGEVEAADALGEDEDDGEEEDDDSDEVSGGL